VQKTRSRISHAWAPLSSICTFIFRGVAGLIIEMLIDCGV
jgi:hypothetical protein